MKIDDAFEGMEQTIKKGFRAKRVFGEPVKVNDQITIIPVAKMKMGGGGRSGKGEPPSSEAESAEGKKMPEGGGFGFKGAIKPVGYIEIKGSKTRWVRIHDWEKLALALPICVVGIGILRYKVLRMDHLGSMLAGKPCRKCGMRHVGPCPIHHAAMIKHMKHHHEHHMKHRHAGGHCPICGMHHAGPCGHGKPADLKAKKRQWKEAARAREEK